MDKIEKAGKEYRKTTANQMYGDELGFINGAKWVEERMFSEEDMIKSSKYGYNFHKTSSFPEHNFEDACIRNTQQWLTIFKKK